MRFMTLICSGISSAVLYIAMLFMVVITSIYAVIGVVLEMATNIVDYHLGDQINVFDKALNGKLNRN
ncbi:MAG: hypothetical protein ACXWTP_00085 [Methylosarcina sp.]